MEEEITRLRTRVRRLEQALDYYANKEHYKLHWQRNDTEHRHRPILSDTGLYARLALEGMEKTWTDK